MPLTVGDVADRLGCKPRDVSDLFYCRKLDAKRCPVVAGRRLIDAAYLPHIAAVLAEEGKAGKTMKAIASTTAKENSAA